MPVLEETHLNGTASASMPKQTIDIKLDDIGYPGWCVTMRTNPRGSVYDDISAQAEEPRITNTMDAAAVAAEKERVRVANELWAKRWWKAFAQITVEWNFADEEGSRIPHPREFQTEKQVDLPILLLRRVISRYFDAVLASATLPKASSDNSEPSSSTSDGDPRPV